MYLASYSATRDWQLQNNNMDQGCLLAKGIDDSTPD